MAHTISVELLVQYLDSRLRSLQSQLEEAKVEIQQLYGAIEEVRSVKSSIQSQNLNQNIIGCE